MQGFIDRLGRDDEGTLWIHDYKTSSRKMSAEDVKNEDQLALYQIGLEQNPKFGPKERIKLIWHFVAFEKDQVVSERNPKEIEWLKQKYVSKIKTIEKAKDFPTKTSALCPWCEYLSLCADGQKAVENKKKKKAEGAAPSPKPAASPAAELTKISSSPAMEPAISPAFQASNRVKPTRARKKNSSSSVSSDQLPLF
jgi:hypothetical protein